MTVPYRRGDSTVPRHTTSRRQYRTTLYYVAVTVPYHVILRRGTTLLLRRGDSTVSRYTTSRYHVILRRGDSTVPRHNTFNRAADVESRCRLRSGSSSALLVPTTRRRTLGDRAFAVAGARVWNSLPATLTSQPSLLMFRRQLKTLLFEQSFS